MQRTCLAPLVTTLALLWSAGARAAPPDASSAPHARLRAVVARGVATVNSDGAYGLAAPVHAGVDVPAPASAEAATLDVRAGELERALADVRGPTRRYYAGWLAAMSVLAVSQGAVGLSVDDRALRESMFLGAGLTVAGIGLLLITPSPGRYGADELHGMPASSLAEKRAKVTRGEELLRGEAATARFRRAWFQHVLITALGSGVGVFLGVRYPEQIWTAAVPSAIGTIAIAELQIWTSPNASIDHWRRYRTGAPSIGLAPSIAPQMLGISLHARF